MNLRRALVTLLLTAGIMFGMVSPASAGALCNSTGICGEIYVQTTSAESLQVTYSFGDPLATDRWVPPGYNSKRWGKDTDGFRVQSGTDVICIYNNRDIRRHGATGWVKIGDDMQPSCRVVRT